MFISNDPEICKYASKYRKMVALLIPLHAFLTASCNLAAF